LGLQIFIEDALPLSMELLSLSLTLFIGGGWKADSSRHAERTIVNVLRHPLKKSIGWFVQLHRTPDVSKIAVSDEHSGRKSEW
jgi:hypothetical protein